MTDIFKVRGWLDYLQLEKATFIVQKPNETMEISRQVANEINVCLINNSDLNPNELYEAYSIKKDQIDESAIISYRYIFKLESNMIKYLRDRIKSDHDKKGIKALNDYLFEINSNSFFEKNPVSRLEKLLNLFVKHKNITARIAEELDNKPYPDSGDDLKLNENQFNELFYKANRKSILYVALYAELIARLIILKSCIEDILISKSDNFIEKLQHDNLFENIRNALDVFKKEKYSYLYPYFWQVFIYLFGGFILNDKKNEEYDLLSHITKIPKDEIPKALKAFDILFPPSSGRSWLINQPNTNITVMQFFPLPLSGVGANYRRIIYRDGSDDSYSNLAKQLNGNYTYNDLIKWNNLAYEFLKTKK